MIYASCRLIQKALDTLPKENVAQIVAAFEGKVVTCIHNHNGNHVIQMAITILSKHAKQAQEKAENEFFSLLTSSLDPIVDEVIADTEGLSCHPYGCRVIQRLVENCTGPHKTKLLDSIISHHTSLVDDQYGNYVIQRVLSYGRSSDKEAIFDTITGANNIFRLSKRKQASNVVEMMIKHGNAPQRLQIIQEMLDVSSQPLLYHVFAQNVQAIGCFSIYV